MGDDQADAGPPAADRFSLPRLRERSARSDYCGQEGLARPDEREGRRDQGADYRARRPGVDGEGLSAARPLRRHDGYRFEVAELDRTPVPGPRYSRPQRRRPSQAWLLDGALWPRVGTYCRPYKSLQHDVRSLLHGREPGWLRAWARLGRN